MRSRLKNAHDKNITLFTEFEVFCILLECQRLETVSKSAHPHVFDLYIRPDPTLKVVKIYRFE